MKLFVGLGNPGNKYKDTRHNVGFMVLDKLAGKLQASYKLQDDWKESKKGKLMYRWFEVEGEKVELIKPVTFMNRSGEAMVYVKKKHPELDLNDLYVVHDDLDIELGKYKIQLRKGPKIHNGLNSIYERLGSKQFWHVRVGINNRKKEIPNLPEELRHGVNKSQIPNSFQLSNNNKSKQQMISGEKYVLQRFSDEERKVFNTVMDEVVYRLCQEFK